MEKINWEFSKEENLDKLKECELFLLDMDGTLYLGDEVFDGAIDFIHKLEEKKLKYIYLTNNSSRAGSDYVDRLKKLGFPCEMENIYTSSMATASFLKKQYEGYDIFVVGTRTFYNELKEAGLKVFNATEYDSESFDKASIDEKKVVVCVGFDTELVYRDLDLAVHFLRNDAPFIAANPDWVCPMPENEVLPDCGSICALLTASTGVWPNYIGKPNRKMVDIISQNTGIANKKICCVGDRLYTDIAVAQNAGAVSACVLSGECTLDEVKEMEVKPDYVLKNVKELGEII